MTEVVVTGVGAITPLGVGASWVLLAKTRDLPTYDLLALTGAQMDEVIAFTYTAGDAPLASTPAWSKPGMWFDALVAGTAYRYTCGRGNYTPGVAGSGVGPRWSRISKA